MRRKFFNLRTRKMIAVALVILVTAYLSGPVFAAIFEIGDRAGPKIYPRNLHEAIYMITWDVTNHDAIKPRIRANFRDEYRPWFYGMHSENDAAVRHPT